MASRRHRSCERTKRRSKEQPPSADAVAQETGNNRHEKVKNVQDTILYCEEDERHSKCNRKLETHDEKLDSGIGD